MLLDDDDDDDVYDCQHCQMTGRVSQYGHIASKRYFLFAIMISNYLKTSLPLSHSSPKFLLSLS